VEALTSLKVDLLMPSQPNCPSLPPTVRAGVRRFASACLWAVRRCHRVAAWSWRPWPTRGPCRCA